MFSKLQSRLVDNWRDWYKMWSVQLAAIAAAIVTTLTANTDMLIGALALLPNGPLKLIVAAVVGILIFGSAAGTRLLKQKDLPDE